MQGRECLRKYINRSSILKSIVITAVLLLMVRVIDYDLFTRLPAKVNVLSLENSNDTEAIAAGSEASFTFSTRGLPFDSVAFHADAAEPDSIYVRLTANDTEVTVYEGFPERNPAKPADREDDSVIKLFLPSTAPGGFYTLNLHNEGRDEIQVSVREDHSLNLGAEHHTYLAEKIAVVILLILAFTLILFFAAALPTGSVPLCYLTLAVPLSVIFLILFAPWNVSDSGAHFFATYRLSNMLTGEDASRDWYWREEDVSYYWDSIANDVDPSVKSYDEVKSHLALRCEKKDMIYAFQSQDKMKYYSALNYWPEVLGVTTGRKLGLSSVVTVYLGRVFLLAFYLASTYAAIRVAPCGQSVLAGVCLLPVSLMMSSAYSYDAMVIAASVSFLSYLLWYRSRRSRRALIVTVLSAFYLGAIKGGGYLILLPAALILLQGSEKRKGLHAVVLIFAAGLFSAILFDKILPMGMNLFQFGEAGSGRMTTMDAVRDPLHYLEMMSETYLTYTDELLFGCAGSVLAWNSAALPDAVVGALLVCIGFCSLYERDRMELSTLDRAVMGLPVLIGLLTTPAMLLMEVERGSRQIEGVQGRYYLPLLPLVLYILTKPSGRVIRDDRGMARSQRHAAAAFAVVSCIAVYYLMRLYLTR